MNTYLDNENSINGEDKKEKDKDEEIREIQIDSKTANKQVKLNILGIEVYFPYKPYDNQIIYMEKVIKACQTKGIAGLESPTGTGKTLCLLCATLAYLKHIRAELIYQEEKNKINGKNDYEKIRQPIIYYTSRTHAQISNVIKELRKTVYRPINAVISSREQSCVNEYINNFSGNLLNLKCKYARVKGECKYSKPKGHGKGWSAYDGLTVDELKEKAKKYKFCPYFFEKDKSIHADIIFLPYNYIFDIKVCSRINLILKNSILIVDEAHNLQEICCESGSIDINTHILGEIISDLQSLKEYFETYESFGKIPLDNLSGNAHNIKSCDLESEIFIFKTLKERINDVKLENTNVKFGQNPGKKIEVKDFFDLLFKSYKGNQSNLKSFTNTSNNNIKQEDINKDNNEIKEKNNSDENNDDIKPELTYKNITKHISFLKDVEYDINNERGKGTLITVYLDFLEIVNLLSTNYYDKDKQQDNLNLYINSFRFYVEEEIEKDSNSNKKKKKFISNSKDNKRILHIYCFNPGLGFKGVMDQNFYSTIITSGTLAPIDSMESELKYNFNYKLENTHVISDSQFNFCVLASSPNNNIEFNFNKENRDKTEMVIELGYTILELSKITPGGILIFFGSYNMLDNYVKKWADHNLISEFSKYKEFFQDRRDSRENKLILEKYQLANSDRKKLKGAILLSVCRGSCSEGMNFKDDMARLVIVIGIPYAMLYEPKVQLKKEFQDQYNKLLLKDEKYKNIKKISGAEWYSQNAIKCVNQALGRVIRHSNDYGAMLLIDTRYQYIVKKNYISIWMRNKCKIYNKNNNKNFLSDMKKFFDNVEDVIKNKKLNTSDNQINNNLKKSFNKNSKKISEKSSKILKDKMNELENSKIDEDGNKFITYHSKKIKINEIKIGGNNQDNEKESKNKEIKDLSKNELEEINDIDESFFDNLSEFDSNKSKKDGNKKLVSQICKNINDKNFKEELGKLGLEVVENDSRNNILTCKICYLSTDNSQIKIEIGKCGHGVCQDCWKKLENSKGVAICPICRKEVKKKDRNIIYVD